MNQPKSIRQTTPAITLTLLHPFQDVAVQSWTFNNKRLIRVGRSKDNDVVLYSAVVSRYHLEIELKDRKWEVVSLGVNGTYLSGKRIEKITAEDEMVLRLASSGPQIQIHINVQKPLSQSTYQPQVSYPDLDKDTTISGKDTTVPGNRQSKTC